MKNNQRVGLSLSGGGFRATIYHLGTLKKLMEMRILDKIDIISTNSGGSITGASYGLYGHNFEQFEKVLKEGVKSSVVGAVIKSRRILIPLCLSFLWFTVITYLLFTNIAWLSLILFVSYIAIFLFFQYEIFPISDLNEKIYNKYFFKNSTLSDFSDNVELAINTTNLETGTLFTFSERKMEDSSYKYIKDGGDPVLFESKKFPVARAVAASTCVPFIFSPVKIHPSYYKNKGDIKRVYPRLVDGGVYDNQGVHKITWEKSSYNCQTVIVSDAGNMMPFKHRYTNVLSLLIRTSDVFMDRIKNFQMIQNIYNNVRLGKREIAYQSLGWNIEGCIPGFINAIKQEQILKSTLKAHNISQSDIDDGDWDKIDAYLRKEIGYEDIIAKANTPEQLEIARQVKTSLVPLNDVQIDALINHAALITEIQVKLYCPSLI